MATGLGELAGAVAGGIVQNINNKEAQESQQRFTEKNMEKAFAQQLQLNRLATPMAVQGMRDAGISPTAMHGPAQPSASPSAPMGAVRSPIDIANIAQAAANVRFTNAEADKAEQEANRMRGEDDGAKIQLIDAMKTRLNRYEQIFGVDSSEYKDLQQKIVDFEQSSGFNVGNLRGASAGLHFDKQSTDKLVSDLENMLQEIGRADLLKHNPLYVSKAWTRKAALEIAQMTLLSQHTAESEAKEKEIDQNIIRLQHEVKQIDADIVEKGSRVALNEITGSKTAAEASFIGQQEKHLKQNDPNSLWVDGEYGSALRALGFNNIGDLVRAAALYKGAKGLKFGQGSVPPTPSFKSSPLGSNLSRLGGKSFDAGASPFKSGTSDHKIFKALEARHGAAEARSRYVDWLKNRSKGQTFTDYNYRKWQHEMKNLYNLY